MRANAHRPPIERPRRWRRDESRLLQAVICGARTVPLLFRGRLHLHRGRVGRQVSLPDGRTFVVFRESSRDDAVGPRPVTLAVWFHLRGIPAGSRLRRHLFERLCLANTLLFAGFDGFQVKLWMVDPDSADYAGLYSWCSAEEADVYARYITGVLRPLSVKRSVGSQVLPATSFEDYLAGSEPGRGRGPVTEPATTGEASGPTPAIG